MAEETYQVQNNRPKSRRERFIEKLKGSIKFSVIFYLTLHISMIVIASLKLSECPVEPNIPQFLLFEGILGGFSRLLYLLQNFLIKYIKISPIISMITTIELIIYIVGSYYVYSEYQPNYDPLSGNKYCNKTVYLFSFIYLTVTYVLLLFVIISIGCFVLGIITIDHLVNKNSSSNLSGDLESVAGEEDQPVHHQQNVT